MYVSVSLSVRQASSAALLAPGIRLRDFAPETVFCERARRTDEDSGQMTGTWKTRVHFFKFVLGQTWMRAPQNTNRGVWGWIQCRLRLRLWRQA